MERIAAEELEVGTLVVAYHWLPVQPDSALPLAAQTVVGVEEHTHRFVVECLLAARVVGHDFATDCR